MHEMAIAESVVKIVEDHARKAGSDKVTLVRLEIGMLSHVEVPALRFGFEAVSKGSIVEGATLEIDHVPGTAWCHDCMGTVDIRRLGDACPTCGSYKLQVNGGEEMRVKDMEVA